jgi:glycosyltransferase involved in cell wall biosynthesis
MINVSVIIPTYNHGNYIFDAIQSVLAQTYSEYEIIVVDDGSTDNTRKTLESLVGLSNFRYVYQANQGQSVARNHGIRLAKGKYISFHDADDLSAPTKLEKQAAYLDSHPAVGLVHSGFSKFDNSGNDLGYRDVTKIKGWFYPGILLEWEVLIGTTSVMVRAEVFHEVGLFDQQMLRAQDLDMWRRIARKFPLGVIPEPLSMYRVHPSNESSELVSKAVPYFEMYLRKAFSEDPSLDRRFQTLAFAKLYENLSHNYLARGNRNSMHLVRKYCRKTIRLNPLLWSVYFIWMASWLGDRPRKILLNYYRKHRYPKDDN